MSRPQTHEQRLLYKADQYLSCLAHTHEERLEILEAVAASKSHCDIIEYWKAFDFSCVNVDASVVNNLLQYIEESGIPVSMAISSLAREPLSIEEQKKNGVFYTDFRLAKFIADDCRDKISIESAVADFAAGTGILIVGIAEEYKKKLPQFFNKWVAHKLYAFDLSSIALRGATAALLSLTNDIDALKTMRLNWKTTDSLLNDDISNLKFDIIVGNPPWGKIKLSRHGFLTQNGEQRVYGAEYENFDHSDYEKTKESLSQYSKLIKQKYNLLGNAEPDMYMAFLQRVTESVVQGGHISYLVPAGLIRSQGTQVLRRYLFSNANRIEFDLLDNQANYFAIDTRFKFVLLSFDKNEHMSDLLKEFLFSMPTAASKNVTKGNEFAKQDNSAALLIIDELNRGPAIEVFGGSIVAIESDKRLNDDNTATPATQYFEISNPADGQMVEYAFSSNLYILAAMNQADASVAPLDVAFMRRWQSYQLKPNYDVLYENFGVDRTQPISTVCSTASDVYSVAIHALEKINELICIGRGKEYQLGQGVFLSTKPKDNSMSSALQFASEAWSMIYAHIEELFFGDSISIGYLVNANSPLSPYKLEELYFAGETKFVLTCSDIDTSNIFNLYQAIAGRDQ